MPLLTLLIQTDSKGYETWVFVVDVSTNWNIVYHSSGPLSSNTLHNISMPVNPCGVYNVYIHDDGGDGMCCSYGQGYYEIWWSGMFIIIFYLNLSNNRLKIQINPCL